jgi:hypothetical protein
MKRRMVPSPVTNSCNNLGFLSVSQETGGFVGGYLVTNAWGRPLEFRLSSAVQPNKVQQILYGESLPRYLCGELIGKTLIDKTPTPVGWVIVDNPLSLELRRHIEIPVSLWQTTPDARDPLPGLQIQPRVYAHPDYAVDVGVLQERLERLGAFDLGEPFARIREAMTEARKMGVAMRGAAA